MRLFSFSLVGAAGLSTMVLAQSKSLFFNAPFSSVTIGVPFTVTYTSALPDTPATITLRKGTDLMNLDTVGTLTASATGGSYTWTPAQTLPPAADYALQITQGSETNYLGPIAILAGAPLSTQDPLQSATSTLSMMMSTGTASFTPVYSANFTASPTYTVPIMATSAVAEPYRGGVVPAAEAKLEVIALVGGAVVAFALAA